MATHALHQLSQLFPPRPVFTEKNVPDLTDKVYIVTGANTGIGKELARILYSKNARVYVAARSKEKASKAIADIKEDFPASLGELVFMHLDLADLSTISSSVQQFLDRESTLHVLFNNAGVMTPPHGSTTTQGYELQLGVNNIGTFMFTKLLTPTLVATAKTEKPGTVRVIWVSSSAAESPSSAQGGVNMDDIEKRKDKTPFTCYALSKAGNYLHGVEMAKRFETEGIISIPLNPGNLNSELYRTQRPWVAWIIRTFVLYPPVYGAYTQLFAGLSPAVTADKSGKWVGPWGRFLTVRSDLVLASKPKADGGLGTSEAFWEWCESKIKPHLTASSK